MTSTPTLSAPATAAVSKADPVWQAFTLLRTVFTIAPILFGLDKFIGFLTEWPDYVAPLVTDTLPITAQQLMYAVGVIEIVAGIVVFLAPRWGALIVAGWLAGIIVNLLLIPGYYDVALRDFGLMIGALSLWRLAASPRTLPRRQKQSHE